jgi:hypothetical protein
VKHTKKQKKKHLLLLAPRESVEKKWGTMRDNRQQ